jgi:hypothetical protein
MKKIITVFTLCLISITQAQYSLKIPMEESKGGFLPNGSIQLISKTSEGPTTPPEPELPTKTCQYLNETSGNGDKNTFWFSWSNTFLITWEGVSVNETGNTNDFFFTEQWKYTKGEIKLDGTFAKISAVCREAI